MMNRLALVAAFWLYLACTPDIPESEPLPLVQARFDPAASPPIVPTPNDLARDPATGQLNLTPPPNASPADQELIAFLNGLQGFPTSSTGVSTFTGALDPSSVTAGTIKAVDLTAGTEVQGLTPFSSELTSPEAPGRISVPPPPLGWAAGHTIAIAIIGGANGVKGAAGEQVAGPSIWPFVRASNPLVTCEDLSSPDCRPTTTIIPATSEDPATRLAEQTQTAIALERLRRIFQPSIDAVVATTGVARDDIALLWTFTTSSTPSTEFNPGAQPARVPTPNDLAIDPATGLVNAPIDPAASAAQQEFTRDYLNTLNGFPTSSAATGRILGAELDPGSVNSGTVAFQNLSTNGVPTPTPTIQFDPGQQAINVLPPPEGWPKGGRFGVAVLGGPTGIRTIDGGEVAASETWALVRGTAPLVTCADLTSPDCASTLTVSALTQAEAIGLEQLRRQFAPLLDQLAAQGIPRERVVLLWTFTVTSLPEATFDPTANVIPFPNDLLLNNGIVNLPVPPDASPLLQALIGGLNTLDGFSLTVPSVSENSEERGPVDVGEVDAATLPTGSGFLKLTSGGTPPQVQACLNCASSPRPDGSPQTAPQQLQFVPTVPLDERSTYGAFLTSELRTTDGNRVVANPTFALLRLSVPLIDANGISQVRGVSDAQASQLEPARQALQPLMDALQAQGTSRSNVALAWSFTTQTVTSGLRAIYGFPAQVGTGGGLAPVPLFISEQTGAVLDPLPLPKGSIGKVYLGAIQTLFLLNGPGGTLAPPPAATVQAIPFTLTLPNTPAPEGGYPVVVFGHGLGRDRNDLLAIADALAAGGRAAIAIDAPFHGERSTCVGSAAFLGTASDDGACADPATQRCDPGSGRCVARSAAARIPCDPAAAVPGTLACTAAGQGACIPDGTGGNVCEGGDFARDETGVPLISGWNFFTVDNLFATRDHFRQPVADMGQLLRVLSDTSSGNNLSSLVSADGSLNVSQIDFVGQSLGAMLGTLSTSASPQLRRAALNIPGGQLTRLFLDSPALSDQRAAFLTALAAEELTPGTPAFDSFIGIAQWILDPGDPVNAAYDLENGPGIPEGREAFIQWIEGDQVIPNSATLSVIAAANRIPESNQVASFQFMPSPSELAPSSRHGFLLNFINPALTTESQSQVVNFLNTGATP